MSLLDRSFSPVSSFGHDTDGGSIIGRSTLSGGASPYSLDASDLSSGRRSPLLARLGPALGASPLAPRQFQDPRTATSPYSASTSPSVSRAADSMKLMSPYAAPQRGGRHSSRSSEDSTQPRRTSSLPASTRGTSKLAQANEQDWSLFLATDPPLLGGSPRANPTLNGARTPFVMSAIPSTRLAAPSARHMSPYTAPEAQRGGRGSTRVTDPQIPRTSSVPPSTRAVSKAAPKEDPPPYRAPPAPPSTIGSSGLSPRRALFQEPAPPYSLDASDLSSGRRSPLLARLGPAPGASPLAPRRFQDPRTATSPYSASTSPSVSRGTPSRRPAFPYDVPGYYGGGGSGAAEGTSRTPRTPSPTASRRGPAKASPPPCTLLHAVPRSPNSSGSSPRRPLFQEPASPSPGASDALAPSPLPPRSRSSCDSGRQSEENSIVADLADLRSISTPPPPSTASPAETSPGPTPASTPDSVRSSRSLSRTSGAPRRALSAPVVKVTLRVQDWSLFLAHAGSPPNFNERFAPTKVVRDVQYTEGPTVVATVRVPAPAPGPPLDAGEDGTNSPAPRQPRSPAPAPAAAAAPRRALSAPPARRSAAHPPPRARPPGPGPAPTPAPAPPAAPATPLAQGWKLPPQAQLRTPPKAASPSPTLYSVPSFLSPYRPTALPGASPTYPTATASPVFMVAPTSPALHLPSWPIYF